MERPDYIEEAVHIADKACDRVTQLTNIAMNRAFNDGMLHAASLCRITPCDTPSEAGIFYADLIIREYKNGR